MSAIEAIILGLVQGLTEFLPVSSSGHLVLGKYLLGVKTGGVAFEVFLHMGTLLAVLLAFRRKIWRIVASIYELMLAGFRPSRLSRRCRGSIWFVLLVIVGSLPAALVGVSLKPFFQRAFENPVFASGMLIITGWLLWSTLLIKNGGRKSLDIRDAVLIGLGQAAAILPGISRSGITIVFALWLGISPRKAAEFSFFLSVPAVLGAAGLEFWEILAGEIGQIDLLSYALGAVIAAGAGYGAILLLLQALRRGRLWTFALYCCFVGIGGLVWILRL